MTEGHWDEDRQDGEDAEPLPLEIVEEEIPMELKDHKEALNEDWISCFMYFVGVIILPAFFLTPFLSAQQAYYVGVYVMLFFLMCHQFHYKKVGYVRLGQLLLPEEWAGMIEEMVPQKWFMIGYTLCLGFLSILPSIVRPLSPLLCKIESATSYCLGGFISFLILLIHAVAYCKILERILIATRDVTAITNKHPSAQNDNTNNDKSDISNDANVKTDVNALSQNPKRNASSIISSQVSSTEMNADSASYVEENANRSAHPSSRGKVLNTSVADILQGMSSDSTFHPSIQIPFYIYRLVQGHYVIMYPIVLYWKREGQKMETICIERTYQDFKSLSKSIQKIRSTHASDPKSPTGHQDCSDAMPEQLCPYSLLRKQLELNISTPLIESKKNPNDKVLYVASLEARRVSLQAWLSSILDVTMKRQCIIPQLKIILLEFLSMDSMTEDMLDTARPFCDQVHEEGNSKGDSMTRSPNLFGVVSMIRWCHSWKDFCFILNQRQLKLFEPDMINTPEVVIPADKVAFYVEGIVNTDSGIESSKDCQIRPLPGMHFMTIRMETYSSPMEYYIGIKSKDSVQIFSEYIGNMVKNNSLRPMSSGVKSQITLPLYTFGSLSDLTVLNKRMHYFQDTSPSTEYGHNESHTFFLNMVSTIMEKPVKITQSYSNWDLICVFSTWLLEKVRAIYEEYVSKEFIMDARLIPCLIEFSKWTGMLSYIPHMDLSLSSNSESSKPVIFYLNIYHTLLLHGIMELGRPSQTTFPIRKFLDCACYDVCGYVYSLTDIEHLILRASMSGPSMAHIIPGSNSASSTGFFKWIKRKRSLFHEKDPRRLNSLSITDPRINFTLNHGTNSSPMYIPIFDTEHFEQQITRASEQYLLDNMRISIQDTSPVSFSEFLQGSLDFQVSSKVSLYIPAMLQWYMRDFHNPKSERHLVKELLAYMSDKQVQCLIRLGTVKLPATQKDDACSKDLMRSLTMQEPNTRAHSKGKSTAAASHRADGLTRARSLNSKNDSSQRMKDGLSSIIAHDSIASMNNPPDMLSSSPLLCLDRQDSDKSSYKNRAGARCSVSQVDSNDAACHLSHHLKIKFIPYDWTPRDVLKCADAATQNQ